jgi:anti-sigma regulatory factor (Ser/Thr protein kinase)
MKQTLILKNDMTELDRLHGFVERLCKKLRLSKKCTAETNLVLEEIFSNIVAYGFGDSRDHSIKINVICPVNGTLVLRIEDKGKAFNPLKVAEPEPTDDIENCGIGGLGIHLVRKLMDDVSYDYSGNKNVLELKKVIN